MDMPQDPNAMSTPAEPADDVDENSDGFEISICCKGDGTITVSKGPLDGDADDDGKPVDGFGAALKEALNLYQAESSGGDSDFQAGFGGAPDARRTKPMPGGM